MDTVETTSTATHTTRNGSRRHKQKKEIDQTRIKIRKPHMSKKDQNSSSASSPDRRKTTVRITDLRARYWSYLFENFHRAVDEIYCVCETDESTIECQEMIMMLDVCRKDFEALITRFEMQQEFERKGRSFAWEVRKSPSRRHGTFESYVAKQSQSDGNTEPSRDHTHNTKQLSDRPSSSKSNNNGFGKDCSWADRVRGYSILAQTDTTTQQHRTQSDTNTQQHRTQSNIQHRTQSNTVQSESVLESEQDVENVLIQETDIQKGRDRTDKQLLLDNTEHVINDTSHIDDQVSLTMEESPSDNRLYDDNTDIITTPTNNEDVDTPINNDGATPLCNDFQTTPPSDTMITSHLTSASKTTPSSDSETTPTTESWKDMMEQYNEEREGSDQLSWADRCESPPLSYSDEDNLNIFSETRETRSPGRAVQLHQKLSSPLRKKSTEQNIKEFEEKQVKAELFREKKKEEMAQKSKSLSEKIRGVQQNRNSITIQKKEAMVERLERAEKKRVSHLQERIRKAQEEDVKVNEIAFINSLEAQNKKIEVYERHQGVEARLLDMQEERQKKIDENIAKEEAAQERRKAIETDRKAKLFELDQKRREQDAKFEQMKQEKEKAREEAAKERERKLEARHVALLLSTEELEKKIQLKHDSSSKRYDQHLVHKKGRAQWGTLSRHSSSDYAPCVEAYHKKKWCRVCNVKIVSEVYLMSHLKGKKHRDSLLANGVTEEEKSDNIIVLAPENIQRQTVTMEVEERMRAGRKRAKKLKQKMSGRMREIEALLSLEATAILSKNYQRLTKLIKTINRFLDMEDRLQQSHLSNIEKTLTELNRILGTKNKQDQSSFCQLGGLTSLSRLILLYTEPASSCLTSKSFLSNLPEKPLLLTLSSIELACNNHSSNCRYMVASNKIIPIIDLAHRYFKHSDSTPSLKISSTLFEHSSPPRSADVTLQTSHRYLGKPLTNICGSLFNVLAVVMSSLMIEETLGELEMLTIKDSLSYVVCVGLIDELAEYFRSVTGPFEEMGTAHLIISGLNMMLAFIAILHIDVKDVFDPKPQDQTQIIAVLRQTELAGILSLLYALLLNNGPPRHSSVPPVLPPYILSITAAGIRAINNTSIVGLRVIQNCLGAEGISLEFRHVIGYLLWYCTHHNHIHLLHELIFAVGYFSVLNNENQMFLLAGRSPTLLQLLCGLPFEYFSDPNLEDILYPTLISSCYGVADSKDVLKLEINCKLLCVYLKSKIEEGSDKTAQQDAKSFVLLPYRFPEQHWRSALEFFTVP